ncbi:NADH-cytochrome b5 reductase [Friedmanniomyces endolithicus]|uniref:NADH-cytochrome b5 reductase n=1 Tax=Friedmanniomyces endolithicus TaxID=329885 RepID=A0A4U0V7A9_9PEZI|nr:NADH-cytochrome b5 reductase [Friedmanniomyces endolithicus]KAK0352455.1 NADH-cytochrome b5 reductase [Friedmanniomyces endolithicus]KAK0770166.1 NADH-cytochrome b5 reductase [Friedmanniomyces endolithicus]KAK0808286.1 NADH-cytochrome b5 reductase [Friedmanniomyces endolithicus]KAK0810434.1 NADH-cytochrome b5 reductase [Friedmanniomyces endolithicus]
MTKIVDALTTITDVVTGKSTTKPTSPFAAQYIAFVYLPSLILIASTAAINISYTPLAVLAAVALGGYQFYTNQERKALDPTTYQAFPLTAKTVISHNTAIYRFALPSPTSILGLPIGQHISLAAALPVTDPKTGSTETKEVVRSYTPISSDWEPGHFDLLIKSYPTGNISRHLATLSVGDTMRVKGPKGAMVYTPNMVRRFGMIAGGTGITPMLQIVRAILRGRSKGDRTEVDLIFANVDEKDILLRNDLRGLEDEDNGFRVHYVLNNPPEKWSGGVGFVTAEMIKQHLPAPAKDIKILICGPPPMVSALKKATESLGYDKARPVSKLEDMVFCF